MLGDYRGISGIYRASDRPTKLDTLHNKDTNMDYLNKEDWADKPDSPTSPSPPTNGPVQGQNQWVPPTNQTAQQKQYSAWLDQQIAANVTNSERALALSRNDQYFLHAVLKRYKELIQHQGPWEWLDGMIKRVEP